MVFPDGADIFTVFSLLWACGSPVSSVIGPFFGALAYCAEVWRYLFIDLAWGDPCRCCMQLPPR